MAHFAVVREQGPAWDYGRARREQRGWAEHAAYMDRLAAERFFRYVGPLAGGPRILAIVDSVDERTVRARLEEDPWSSVGLLRTLTVEPWEVLVGNEELDRDPRGSPDARARSPA